VPARRLRCAATALQRDLARGDTIQALLERVPADASTIWIGGDELRTSALAAEETMAALQRKRQRHSETPPCGHRRSERRTVIAL
jgi:hypothetical protein